MWTFNPYGTTGLSTVLALYIHHTEGTPQTLAVPMLVLPKNVPL